MNLKQIGSLLTVYFRRKKRKKKKKKKERQIFSANVVSYYFNEVTLTNQRHFWGAMTLSLTTLSLMTLSKTTLSITFK
jgi:hypothetical protein